MKKNIKHFFLLTGLTAGTLHLMNRFICLTADMKHLLSSQNSFRYDWKHGTISYTKQGTGSPLLLIHDLTPISSSYEWKNVIPELAKNHTVYTLDLLGCGYSDKPCLTYTNYLYVQLITDFIRNVIGEKTTVAVSNESISFVVLCANMQPELIFSIISINPPALKNFSITANRTALTKKALLQLPVLGTFLYHLGTSNLAIQKKFETAYFADPKIISSKLTDAYYESAHFNYSKGKYLAASMQAQYTKNNFEHALKKLEIPIFIIESEEIKDAHSIADAYSSLNSNTNVTFLPDCKNYPHLEISEKFLQTISFI